ncbi:uncharacterized protein METZ01_LOCUS45849 [marine metagenome]|uniref:Uncharacterized protein n=1 Tax=marine metagenome TaxID=408172 RepID=A0A381RMA5_9ZZZZ
MEGRAISTVLRSASFFAILTSEAVNLLATFAGSWKTREDRGS